MGTETQGRMDRCPQRGQEAQGRYSVLSFSLLSLHSSILRGAPLGTLTKACSSSARRPLLRRLLELYVTSARLSCMWKCRMPWPWSLYAAHEGELSCIWSARRPVTFRGPFSFFPRPFVSEGCLCLVILKGVDVGLGAALCIKCEDVVYSFALDQIAAEEEDRDEALSIKRTYFAEICCLLRLTFCCCSTKTTHADQDDRRHLDLST
jgi:hypothetical protein